MLQILFSIRVLKFRVPATAGTHLSASRAVDEWVLAFAGTRD